MSTSSTTGDASPDGERFEKRLTFEKVDEEEQIAYGAVLVPWKLDHQGDFLREETIADLRESFQEASTRPGVMHAVFPGDDVALAEDRLLAEAETLGEKDLPAGTWVQGWQYDDEELWELVSDGVLAGNSIGGTAKGRTYEPGTLPDEVEIPDTVQAELDEAGLDREDIAAREITEGRILEVSAVDFPAVPDATHEQYKSDLAKAAPALTENVVAAQLYLEQRGHDEADAQRLAEWLNEHKSRSGAGGLVARAKEWLAGGDDGHAAGASSTQQKDGRTLSEANIRSVKALHDASIDMLDRSDIDHRRLRFTDDPGDDFEIADYGSGDKARELARNEPADTGVGSGAAAGSEVDMTEDITEQIEALNDRLDTIDEKLSADEGDEEQDEEKTETDDTDGPSTEEKVDQLADAVSQMADQVEQMASAQGVSQQADQGEAADGGEEKVWGENSPFAPGGGS